MKEPDPLLRLFSNRRHSTAGFTVMVDIRLSLVKGFESGRGGRTGSLPLSVRKTTDAPAEQFRSPYHAPLSSGSFTKRKRDQKHFKKRLQLITPFGVINCMDQLTDVLTAISHPTRRAIIGQLAHGPARFLDVAEPFDTALNAVTKHLKLLERAGLIEREKRGREVFISFRGEPLREVAGWVHEYERFWNQRLDQFEQYFFKDKRRKEKK